jgi:pyruvate dehydrogenase E1 component
MLESDFGVACDVWSVTSYKQLYLDAQATERWNMLHPDRKPRRPYVARCLDGSKAVTVATSDYVKALPESIGRWAPGRFVSLGTDGFGRSDTREGLRDFFEVDRRYVTLATLWGLAQEGKLEAGKIGEAIKKLKINREKPDPISR